jgi:ribose transport system substrate-binding protein
LLLATGVAAAMAFTMAACGGDDDKSAGSAAAASSSTTKAEGGNDVVAAAQARLKPYLKADKIGPTVPFDKGQFPKGKYVIYVNCGAPICVEQGKGFTEAAKTAGWKVETIQAIPTPESIQKAFDEVARRKPDAVVSAGFGASLYPRQIQTLNGLKVPVLSSMGAEESGQKGIIYDPLPPADLAKGMSHLADKAIVDMKGEGVAGVVLLGGYPIVKFYTEGYKDEIKSKCPKCTIKQIDVQPADIGKDGPSKISNFIRANPGMKTLLYSYDALGIGVPAAAKAAGLTKIPYTYSWAPDNVGLAALETGERQASLFQPARELGWQDVDAMARIFAGRDLSEDKKLQTLTVVSKDLDNIPQKGPGDSFPPAVPDYRDQFKALWGI